MKKLALMLAMAAALVVSLSARAALDDPGHEHFATRLSRAIESEPRTSAMLLAGLGLLGAVVRRRRL